MRYFQKLLALCAVATLILAVIGCFSAMPATPQIDNTNHPTESIHCKPHQWYMDPDSATYETTFRQCNVDGNGHGARVGSDFIASPAEGNEAASLPSLICEPDTWYIVPCNGKEGRNFGFVQCSSNGYDIVKNNIVICGYLGQDYL